jgi:hypothetical protein
VNGPRSCDSIVRCVYLVGTDLVRSHRLLFGCIGGLDEPQHHNGRLRLHYPPSTIGARDLVTAALSDHAWLVDCETYVGKHPRLDIGAADLGALRRTMQVMHISNALVTSTHSVWGDAAQGNSDLSLLLAHRNATALGPVWVLLPPGSGELPPADIYVERALANGVAAFRAYPSDNGYDLTSLDCDQFLQAMQARGLPLMVDATQCPWVSIAQIAGRHPVLSIVVSNVGYRTMRVFLDILDRHENIALTMSNMVSHQGIDFFVQRFGSTRLLFGSAMPIRDPAEVVAMLLWSGLSDREVLDVGRENALALFSNASTRWAAL